MVELQTSIRTDNKEFQELQSIARKSHYELINNPQLVTRFVELLKCITFVEDWGSEIITEETYRLYGKKVPAKKAAQNYVKTVKKKYINKPNELLERKSIDTMKNRFSHRDMIPADEKTSTKLETQCKEPQTLLFFKGAKYDFTYNKEGSFSNAQLGLLYDLPSKNDLENFKKIKILAAPGGIKDIHFDESITKEELLANNWKEVFVETPRTRVKYLNNNMQARRRQYGLRHRVTGTIHAAMGDTLKSVASEISLSDPNFKLWDKGQLIVLLSRTKDPTNTILVGNKSDTIKKL